MIRHTWCVAVLHLQCGGNYVGTRVLDRERDRTRLHECLQRLIPVAEDDGTFDQRVVAWLKFSSDEGMVEDAFRRHREDPTRNLALP